MILKHRHTALVTRDVLRIKAYYEGLGLQTYYSEVETWGRKVITVVKLATPSGDPVLELIEGPWRNHVCFEVDKIPPGIYLYQKRDGDGNRTVFIDDPDGNLIELTEIKEVP